MTIRIYDNVMSRPQLPGSGAQGEPDPTRSLGHRTVGVTAMPSAARGMGGIPNPAAGAVHEAAARAAQVVQQSVNGVGQYIESLRDAEEADKAKLMFLKFDQADGEVRSRLDADPEYGKLPTSEQQSRYELERDAAIEAIRQETGLTRRSVTKAVESGLAEWKVRTTSDYVERVVKPRVVEVARQNDIASDDIIISSVAKRLAPETVKAASDEITTRYTSPEAYAKYGAAGARKMLDAAVKRLTDATLNGFADSMERSSLAKFEGGEISTENLLTGPVAERIADEKLRLGNTVAQLPVSEAQRAQILTKGEKAIEQFAKLSVKDHNSMVKEANRQRLERVQDVVDTMATQYGILAGQGKLSSKEAYVEFTRLSEFPEFKDDPQAQKKLYLAYGQVQGKIDEHRRHQERLASESRTRDTITQLRMENGVGVTGAQADQVWRKNGMLDSFFKGGGQINSNHLGEIEKAGAVPSTIIESIKTDLGSSDPKLQLRGAQNLLHIKRHSAKSQQALYKELPDEYAGVINRLENGQSPREALSFLTRDRATPDVEKTLRAAADDRRQKAVSLSAMKDAGLEPAKMNPSLAYELGEQWKEAYVRARGDEKLAADLFRQELAKNRNIGVSKFTGNVEKFPITNFTGSKEIATQLIEKDFPEIKGKEIVPLFAGVKTNSKGEQVPTYDIFMRGDDGLMRRVTDNNRLFYTDNLELQSVVQAEHERRIEEGLKKAQAQREAERQIELQHDEIRRRYREAQATSANPMRK